jgi:hypothetical protein
MLHENLAQSRSVAGGTDIINMLERYLDRVASGVVPPTALVERGRRGSYTDHRTPTRCLRFAEKGRRPKEPISWRRVATTGWAAELRNGLLGEQFVNILLHLLSNAPSRNGGNA